MMNNRITGAVILAVGLVLALTQTADAISCYQCNSANNSMCLKPENVGRFTYQIYPTRCDGDYDNMEPFCRKIEIQVLIAKDIPPEKRVIRSCGWIRDTRERPCYKADNEDHFETVCQCFTEGCNSARKLGIVYSVFVFLLVPLLANKLVC